MGSRIQSVCWERMGTTSLASYWLEVSVCALYLVQVRSIGTRLSGYGCEVICTSQCECRQEMCINQWPIPKQLLVELRVVCTTTNILVWICNGMRGVGSGMHITYLLS